MPTILPPSLESYHEMIDKLTAMQDELGRMKTVIRAHIQHAMRTPGRRTPEEEVLYQIERLGEPTATDIHNYAKWIDRAIVCTILERFLASGQVLQRKTPHTIRYRIAQ